MPGAQMRAADRHGLGYEKIAKVLVGWPSSKLGFLEELPANERYGETGGDALAIV
jgi:hypothetical protein